MNLIQVQFVTDLVVLKDSNKLGCSLQNLSPFYTVFSWLYAAVQYMQHAYYINYMM